MLLELVRVGNISSREIHIVRTSNDITALANSEESDSPVLRARTPPVDIDTNRQLSGITARRIGLSDN